MKSAIRPTNLPVGTLQTFLDTFLKEGGAEKIDYVHGEEVVCQLGAQAGNAGFYVPGMHKSDLFKTVILDGALPRKTFSMGEAKEKRFYMEARKINKINKTKCKSDLEEVKRYKQYMIVKRAEPVLRAGFEFI